MSRRFARRAILLAAVIAVLAGLWFVIRGLEPPFNPVAWRPRPTDTENPSARWQMVSDLMKHHLKVGMTRSEVEKLLGPPDSTSAHDRAHNKEGYDLGQYGFMAFDPRILQITYDKRGRLASMTIIQS